jgi:hypothetical protein
MKIEVNWMQSSTFRGAVRIAVLIFGCIGWWAGKDVTGIILIGTGINGMLGFATTDGK